MAMWKMAANAPGVNGGASRRARAQQPGHLTFYGLGLLNDPSWSGAAVHVQGRKDILIACHPEVVHAVSPSPSAIAIPLPPTWRPTGVSQARCGFAFREKRAHHRRCHLIAANAVIASNRSPLGRVKAIARSNSRRS